MLSLSKNNPKQQQKILISVDALHNGGAEMFAIRLANYLADSNKVFFMEFDGLASSDKKLKSTLSKNIVFFSPSETIIIRFIYFLNRISRYKWWRKFGKLSNLYRQWLVSNFIKKWGIEVIHSHAIFQNVIFCGIKEKQPSIRFIVTLHGHFEFYMREDPIDAKYLIDILKDKVDAVAYLTEEHLNTFLKQGFDIHKTRRVLNGFHSTLNLYTFNHQPRKSKSFTIMIHSRAIEEKGWIQAIEAVKILLNKGKNLKLIMVGDGPLIAKLKIMDLPQEIEVLGFKKEVFPFIQACDIGLLPSYFSGESLPNSIIEYLYFFKPVIASNIGAIPEMLDAKGNGIAGILLDTEKGKPVDVNQLAQSISQLMDDKALYDQKVMLTGQAFEKFTMDKCANTYLAMYQPN